MYVFLIIMIRKEEQKINRKYQNFLLERYLKKYHFSKNKKIQKEEDFYRYKNNFIWKDGQYRKEEDYLRKKYNNF